MNVAREAYAIHGDPTTQKNELIEIGRNLVR